MPKSKFIFVTGGVTSSLGKGIIASSLGNLFQSRGYKTTIIKLDPYLNVDPGTLNPYEHGECYVTDDGSETDLDLGHYERFLSISTSHLNNVTSGAIYQSVIEKERNGDFLGKTIQVIPHITDEIKSRISSLEKNGKFKIIIVEIGGTVGDIESLPYIEALRQFKFERKKDVSVIHLTLLPYLSSSGELKTKPTQHSVKTMLQSGVQPDIIVCRSKISIDTKVKDKIALFCNVNKESVIEALDADTIYKVPLMMLEQKLDLVVANKLGLKKINNIDNGLWLKRVKRLKSSKKIFNVGIIGKYVELKDSYISIHESLVHASAFLGFQLNIHWIQSDELNSQNVKRKIDNCDGVIVAPGFGSRGIDGKLTCVKYIRKNKIPFMGICLGMQVAVIEFARNVCKLKNAHSTEIDSKTKFPVIDIMANQHTVTKMGGTMRLGGYSCRLKLNTKAYDIYKKEIIFERHRHRYELNNDFRKILSENGMVFSGINDKLDLVEMIEIKNHPWFIGVQFHPEYKSKFVKPHPLFISFVESLNK